MASLFLHCLVIVCAAGLTLAILDTPCNNESVDCDAGECCATSSSANAGYTGVCRQYTFNCNPGGPKDGECGCGPDGICRGYAVRDALYGICMART